MSRILIADDNADSRYLLRVVLQSGGHAVEEAMDGRAALDMARTDPPDLLITDLMMPVLDGYGLLRERGADPKLRAVPCIVYSATFTDENDERLARTMGADGFLVKPMEPEALLAAVQDVLGRAAPAAPRPGIALPEETTLRLHNELLIAKLEQRNRDLVAANSTLRAEMAARAATEASAAQTERLLHAVMDCTNDAIFVKSSSHRYLMVNKAAARNYGLPPEEIVGRTDAQLVPAHQAEVMMRNDRQVLESGESTITEVELTRDGTTVASEVLKAPYRDARGQVIGIVGIARDLTERRRLEAQLRQAQKMEAVGRLAGGIAHDFNNLLTVIYFGCEAVASHPGLPPEVLDSISTVLKASDRATALTTQLLAFSRRSVVKPQIIDLNDQITNASTLLTRVIGEDIVVSLIPGSGLRTIRADPTQIDQILMNLAVNARDAMPNGGRLTIETANVDLTAEFAASHLDSRAGPHVMLAVTDTGTGIPRDVLPNIFDPFFTTKEQGKGTGLGLSMVFGIVKQSGGAIHVYSELGHGTMFKVYLPATNEEPAAGQADTPSADAGGKEIVLLVEDDDELRRLALEALSARGYLAIGAVDGLEALRLVESGMRPDLLLSDVVMPRLSGPDLVERLRPLLPGLRVLFTSGYTDHAAVNNGLLLRNNAFLQKPYSPQDLARKVRTVLDATPPA